MKLIYDGRQYLPVDDPQSRLFLNRAIEKFLEVDERRETFFLVGPKGTGKTTLLRQKSHIYRNNPGIKYNVNNKELVEYLTASTGIYSKEKLIQFKELDLWERIWRHCLRAMALKVAAPPGLSEKVRELIEGHVRVSSLLQGLLSGRDNIFKKLELYEEELTKEIGRIQSGIAIFIDNIDQAFDRTLRAYHYTDKFHEGKLSDATELWVNAQIGLLSSAYYLNSENAHIKVFATCRSEAYELVPGMLKWNLDNYTTKLEYTKDEIEEIMNLKLNEMGYLKTSDNHSPLSQFLGLEKRPHPFVIDPKTGEYEEENLFNYLYRHTFGRPREIVMLLNTLDDQLVSLNQFPNMKKRAKLERIRDIVNETSHDFFLKFQDEIIPYFDEDKSKAFFKTLETNYIKKEDLENYNGDTLKAFHAYGLMGYTVNKYGELIQKFLPAARYNYRTFENLPPADHYLLHSSLDQSIINVRGYEKHHNRNNIIGDGYKFRVPDSSKGIKYFKPKKIHAKRWKVGNAGYKHELPIKEYYKTYFSNDSAFIDKLQTELNDTFSELIKLCGLKLINQYTKNKYEVHYRVSLDRLFSTHNLKREYQKMLNGATADGFSTFYNRLYGRLIMLGGLLLLNLDCSRLHSLMVAGESKIHDDEVTVLMSHYLYLLKAFYIHGLKADPAKLNKNEIYDCLSPFEKTTILGWTKYLREESLILGNIESPDDQNWLKENFKKQHHWSPV